MQVLFLTGENELGEEVNYLRRGKNVFAIKVLNGVSEAGLIFDGKWTTASGGSLSIVSLNDDSIRATKSDDPGNIRVEPKADANGKAGIKRGAIIVYAATAIVSLLGMLGYNAWIKRKEAGASSNP